ncbi:hypothetical protein BDA99DRAFT_540089 [Phascolomyces articulosus]|uniref:Uncharacterized protein n=1 Tax=Phascolomyces articulosus TaxID=60185 RepID=A0AAD5JUM3_9FUNG|nr:hypothetical protein BDA99DRAFT_540089 [Phascolomyces articulosus]
MYNQEWRKQMTIVSSITISLILIRLKKLAQLFVDVETSNENDDQESQATKHSVPDENASEELSTVNMHILYELIPNQHGIETGKNINASLGSFKPQFSLNTYKLLRLSDETLFPLVSDPPRTECNIAPRSCTNNPYTAVFDTHFIIRLPAVGGTHKKRSQFNFNLHGSIYDLTRCGKMQSASLVSNVTFFPW